MIQGAAVRVSWPSGAADKGPQAFQTLFHNHLQDRHDKGLMLYRLGAPLADICSRESLGSMERAEMGRLSGDLDAQAVPRGCRPRLGSDCGLLVLTEQAAQVLPMAKPIDSGLPCPVQERWWLSAGIEAAGWQEGARHIYD